MSDVTTAPPELTLPSPSVLSQPFWDACRRHQLAVQRCEQCRKFRFYPTAACPHCASPDHRWEQISGKGTIYSWIVVRKTPDPYWRQRAPYICAIVELQEQKGLLMAGLLCGVEPARVVGGMSVSVVFEDASPSISLPRWQSTGA